MADTFVYLSYNKAEICNSIYGFECTHSKESILNTPKRPKQLYLELLRVTLSYPELLRVTLSYSEFLGVTLSYSKLL